MSRTLTIPSQFLRPNQEHGSVLIIVLWISTGLVTVVLLFGESMMLEYRASENTLAGIQAEQTLEGVVRYICYTLDNLEEEGTIPGEESLICEAGETTTSMYWLIGRDPNYQFYNTPVYGIVDEGSKLNLNTATQEMLQELPGMTSEFAAAIIDWRDEDSDVSENGAESESYVFLRHNYDCKNAFFESIFELQLVYNAYFEILYGEDTNLNGLLDENENDGDLSLPSDNQDGQLDFGILEYVTIYSRIPNSSEDSEKVNINGDDEDALTELLEENLGEDRASEIEQRIGQGQEDYESVLEFYIRSEMTQEEFSKIEDQLTTSDDEYLTGLVNVNTASVSVLNCIPGIEEEDANQLVSYRQSNEDNIDSIAWVKEALEEETAIEAGPYITVKSYQFTLDVAAVGHNWTGYRRSRFVIDTSEGEAKIVYRRDLSGLGWALGSTLRNELEYVKEQIQ